ncbi:hypothetical protein [Neorhodopirellula pilleata]|uniref:hypothetical protein n=1 Tax=Neorhodopirellula pilleata TaxID=2714738 RepID=UPI0018CFD189|nr:hypothetical protein [Neorhodopirellula pilleata]
MPNQFRIIKDLKSVLSGNATDHGAAGEKLEVVKKSSWPLPWIGLFVVSDGITQCG